MKKFTIALALLLSASAAVPTTAEAASKWTNYRIMLDPGHGGSDPGAQGPSAPHEATLALRCATELNTQITGSTLGGTVKMTRTTDATVSLSSRRSMSVSYDPYIFCSIHLNAFNKTANGTETWYYWSTGNSLKLANKVHAQLVSQLGRTNRGVKQNGWTVITGSSSVPAILTEALFVDNSTEWGMINKNTNAGFKAWVNGHLYGFYDHLKSNLGVDVVNPKNGTTSGGTTTEPTLTVSTTSLHYTCYTGETPSLTFTVTGKDLTNNISVASSHPWRFEVDPASTGKTGGTITVKLAHTDEIGEYGPSGDGVDGTFYVTVKSGSLSKKVTLTATVKAKPLNAMTEKWNFSEKRGTTTQGGYDATKIRNFCYKDGKLYCVYNHSEIKVLNAQTGEDLGNLNKGSVISGGVLALCDVKTVDGRIVACNLDNAGGEVRLYCWENDQAEPYLLHTITDFMGATRIGDCIELRGTFNGDLIVTFGNDDNTTTRILEFTRNSSGKWSQKAISVTTDGTTRLSTQGTTRVYSKSTGYWIDGKDSYPTWVKLNDSGVAVRNTMVDTGESWGSSHHEFKWAGNKHSVNIVFNGKEYTSDGSLDATKNYKGARARIITDPTGDFTRMEQVADYPADGLGEDSRNTNATADAYINTDGSTYAELWVQSTTHGIAYFAQGTPPTHTVTPITPSAPTLSVNPSTLNVTCTAGETATGDVTVSGSGLTGDINLELSGVDAQLFSLSTEKLSASGKVTVTYSPTAEGTHTATLTLSSTGANDVTVSITGTATPAAVEIKDYSLTQDWAKTTGHITPSKAGYGWSTGFEGKIYFNDNANQMLKYWDSTGLHDAIASADGTAITSDAAGNIILSVGYYGTSATTFKVLPKGGSSWQDLSVTLPDGITAAATKYIGKVIGNVVTGGGVMMIIPNGSTKVVKIYISKGAQASSKAIDLGGIFTADAETFAMPLESSVNSDKLAVRLRSSKHFYHNLDGSFTALANNGINTTQGGTMFTLNEKLYSVEPIGTNYGDGFQIVNVTDNKVVATHAFTVKGTLSPTPNSITAEIIDKNTVRLYQYVPGVLAAQYTFLAPSSNTGIEDVNADVTHEGTAEVEYYNLQGVRVDSENLTPGIYIRRQGNTVGKVLVK